MALSLAHLFRIEVIIATYQAIRKKYWTTKRFEIRLRRILNPVTRVRLQLELDAFLDPSFWSLYEQEISH